MTSHDGRIIIYEVNAGKAKKLEVFHSSTSGITQIDWCEDGQSVRTNDLSYEILYYNLGGGQDKSGASNMRDEYWATVTCPFGWATQGVWPAGAAGNDINRVARSKGPVVDGMQLIASADDFGQVNLFRYPAMVENANPLTLRGHSSHVTKVAWNHDDSLLFSTGGNDTSVMKWRIHKKN